MIVNVIDELLLARQILAAQITAPLEWTEWTDDLGIGQLMLDPCLLRLELQLTATATGQRIIHLNHWRLWQRANLVLVQLIHVATQVVVADEGGGAVIAFQFTFSLHRFAAVVVAR